MGGEGFPLGGAIGKVIGMSKLGSSVLALVCALFGCSFNTGAESEEAAGIEEVAELSSNLVKNALSRKQQATVLKLVDDICGDTWCEGDHNFSFDRLDCRMGCAAHAGSCELTFRIFSYDTDIETGPTYVRSCTTAGFTGLASLVETTNGYQSLQPEYYAALSACIGEVESQLPLAAAP
jgi:hypothetical protein